MRKKRIIAGLLVLCMSIPALFSFTAADTQAGTEDFMDGVENEAVVSCIDPSAGKAAVADFSMRLFQNSIEKDENVMISPVSVLYALAMTANGAKGETLSQMEEVFGMKIGELNDYLDTDAQILSTDEKCKLDIANSVWFKDDGTFTVNPDFLQINAEYYDAGVFGAAFDDETLDEINSWVSDKTDGMIDSILDKIQDEVAMYLINAICFDAEWSETYKDNQVTEGIFKLENGESRDAQYMSSEETRYLKDGESEGFLKYYAGERYAFAAMLPAPGMSVKSYADSLTGARLTEVLENAEDTTVQVSIPKFKSEYKAEMSDILKKMGIVDAFETKADLSGLGESGLGKLFISRVLHKTYIDVNEKGTEAAAATAVEIMRESAVMNEKRVMLDRPFLYMIIDCNTNTPVFMGTMMDVG